MMDIRQALLISSSAIFMVYLLIDTFWVIYWQMQVKIPPDSFDLLMDRDAMRPGDISLDEIERQLEELTAWGLSETEKPEQWSEVLRYGDKIEL